MKIIKLGILAGVLALGGCYPTSNLGPAVFTDATETIVGPTSLKSGARRGQACAKNILGLIAQGDYSVGEAIRNGSITQVQTVDTKIYSVLGFLYHERCTIVYGN